MAENDFLSRAHAPLSERLCDGFVLSFAGWTVVANATVRLGGNLHWLLVGAAISALAVLAVLAAPRWFAIRRGNRAPASAASAPKQAAEGTGPSPFWRAAGGCAAGAIVASYGWRENSELLWAGTLALSACALALDRKAPLVWQAPVRGRALELGLFALCAASALVALVAHRPDADDAFYLNLAVSAVDHPRNPLIAYDTLHGMPGIPLVLPIYRVHSIELLGAAISYVSGLRVLDVAHLLFPTLAALLVPLSLARAHRLLTPRRWLWSVAFSLLFLLCTAESAYSFGALAFTRLHQGKAVFLSALLPLIIAYALDFARAPTGERWLRLAAAQIAAVGFSASALWLAPAVAGLALLAATPLQRGSGRHPFWILVVGGCASAYVLVLALSLQAGTQAAFRDAAVKLASTQQPSNALAREAVRYVFWISPLAFATLFSVLSTWSLGTSALQRRFAAVFLFGLTLCFWNPYTAQWVAAHITGAPTYWRTLWVLPVPLLVATALCSPIELLRGRWPRWAGPALCALLALMLVGLTQQNALTASQVWLGRPSWKIPPQQLSVAREIARLAPEGTLVLAPLDVSSWLPALHHHPSPIVVRKHYTPVLTGALGREEVDRRVDLARMATGLLVPPHGGELLSEAIAQYPLQVVCMTTAALENRSLRSALKNSKLERVRADDAYEIWARPHAPR